MIHIDSPRPMPQRAMAWDKAGDLGMLGVLSLVVLVPGPPNYRWFLVVFGYLKASRNHLPGGFWSVLVFKDLVLVVLILGFGGFW